MDENNLPLSSQTGARQTMSSWSRVIESFDEVPETFKPACQSAMGTSFPYTVFAPVIAGIRHKTSEKLLCEGGDTLYVWERARESRNMRCRSTGFPILSLGVFCCFPG